MGSGQRGSSLPNIKGVVMLSFEVLGAPIVLILHNDRFFRIWQKPGGVKYGVLTILS